MDHNIFIRQLAQMNCDELLDAYMEAKTGHHDATEILPVRVIDNFLELQKWVDEFNTNKVLRGLADENE